LLAFAASDAADQVDFDQRILDEQAGRTDGGSRRRDLELFLPNLVEAVEVVEVGEEDLRLEHAVERVPAAANVCF
jgi:hypothetical protein